MFNDMKKSAVSLVERTKELHDKYEFSTIDYKIHGVAAEVDRLVENGEVDRFKVTELFAEFYEIEFENFQHFLAREGLTLDYVNSSDFRIITNNKYVDDALNTFYKGYGGDDPYETLFAIYETYHGGNTHEEIIELIVTDEIKDAQALHEYEDMQFIYGEDLDDMILKIDVFIDEMHEHMGEVEDELKRIAKMYKYVDDFKAKQVTRFKEFYEERK